MKNLETKIGDKTLTIQLDGLAEQASGCCLVRYGDTSVLCTSQIGEEKQELGFLPLTCNYEERYYAAGKILGSRFIRREGRPSSEAVLIARMIDRALRPLFPEKMLREIQCIVTCLSWDAENDPAVLGLLGSSLSLSLSDIPWRGPVGVVRVVKVGENFILNPNYEEREKGELDIVFSGIDKQGQILLNMIEAKGNEVEEEAILEALDFVKPVLKQIINFQKQIVQKHGKNKVVLVGKEIDSNLERKIKEFLKGKLEKVLYQKEKQTRDEGFQHLQEELLMEVEKDFGEGRTKETRTIFDKEKERILKENIIAKERRPDGRKLDEVREISIEAGILPRTHGSGLFTRGETRALSILTLGAPGDQQLLDGMEISGKKRFLHHYNFPPYSVGEVRSLMAPNRREIGHGMLAEKALLPLIPSFEDFPYTIRIVSEMLSSNGSTSMASVSSSSLALMDAGVPIKRPAAGVAIGLITDKNQLYQFTPLDRAHSERSSNGAGQYKSKYKLLTDIQGPEDHYGDMDLKVAGTEKGITVVQMDVKVDGIEREILEAALRQGKTARLEILKKMNKVLPGPRTQLSPFAPRVYALQINPEKIGGVIGPGGRVINEIIAQCGVSIDIEESGRVFVTAENEAAAKKAIDWIKNITKEVKVGEVFQGKVKRILDFGAIVEIAPHQEGMVHISQFTPFRLDKVQDVVKVGDVIPVKIINIDEQGRISLSAKEAGFRTKRK